MADVELGRLKYKVIADDTEAQGAFSKLSQSIFNLKNLILSYISIRMFSSLIRDAGEFATKLSQMSAAGVEHLGKVSDSIEKLSIEFGKGLKEQAEGFYKGLRSGIDEANLAEFMQTANKLAVTSSTDLKIAVNALDSAIDTYGLSVQDAATVADKLWKSAQKGEIELGELSSALTQVAPLAKEAGVSFDDLLASLTTMTSRGISTSKAAMTIQTLIAELVTPSEELAATLNSLGIEIGMAGIKSYGLTNIMNQLYGAVNSNSDAFAQFFPGARTMGGLLTLVSDNGAKLNTNLIDIQGSMGALDESFKNFKGSTDALKLNQMKAEWDAIKTTLGTWASKIWTTVAEPILKTMVAIIDKIKEWYNVIADELSPAFSIAKDIWYDAMYGEDGIITLLKKGETEAAMAKMGKMINDMWHVIWYGGKDSGGHEYKGLKSVVDGAFASINWIAIFNTAFAAIKGPALELGKIIGQGVLEGIYAVLKAPIEGLGEWVGNMFWNAYYKLANNAPIITYEAGRSQITQAPQQNFTMGNLIINNPATPISSNLANQIVSELNTKIRRGEVIFNPKRGFVK